MGDECLCDCGVGRACLSTSISMTAISIRFWNKRPASKQSSLIDDWSVSTMIDSLIGWFMNFVVD